MDILQEERRCQGAAFPLREAPVLPIESVRARSGGSRDDSPSPRRQASASTSPKRSPASSIRRKMLELAVSSPRSRSTSPSRLTRQQSLAVDVASQVSEGGAALEDEVVRTIEFDAH